MPTYLYRCGECGEEWEAFNYIPDRHRSGGCGKCGGGGEIIPTTFSNLTFRKRWFEGIHSQPVFVENQKQLTSICNKSKCHVVTDDRRKQKRYYEKRGMVEEGKRVCKRGGG